MQSKNENLLSNVQQVDLISSQYKINLIVVEMQTSFFDWHKFNSNVLSLIGLIPSNILEIISVEVLVVLLLSSFQDLHSLHSQVSYHFQAILIYLSHPDAQSFEVLQSLTENLVSFIKITIEQMIGLPLSPQSVFILLTCIELFRNLKNFPIELLILAVNNCKLKSESIISTSSLPSIYTLLISSESPYLPVFQSKEYSLVVDLDETLGHFYSGNFFPRPGVQKFIEDMHECFELILFTSAEKNYADWAMQTVDPSGLVILRLYQEHLQGHFKNLQFLGRSLEKIIIIDNFAESFAKQPENGILIKSWINDTDDDEFKRIGGPLKWFLKNNPKDVYEIVRLINNKLGLDG